jgi:hypothetical protein
VRLEIDVREATSDRAEPRLSVGATGAPFFKSRVSSPKKDLVSARQPTSQNDPTDLVHSASLASPRENEKTETEFVAAFDVLLRNHREFVPPQHFLERLTHILLRRRERVARSVFQRDDDDDDDEEVSRKREKTETNASSLAAREDDRLLRATAEIFRRVNAAHPVAVAARFGLRFGFLYKTRRGARARGRAHVDAFRFRQKSGLVARARVC